MPASAFFVLLILGYLATVAYAARDLDGFSLVSNGLTLAAIRVCGLAYA